MESIYGKHYPQLNITMEKIINIINSIRKDMEKEIGMDPVEHCLSRIKSEESMREKCRRKNIPEDENSALYIIKDAIGIRIVCAFIDDVYEIRDRLKSIPFIEIIEEKDYISNVKENGYRSLHIIIRVDNKYYSEIQIRTISMDTWAALEHHIKYKKNIGGNISLITRELKRCSDELASTDTSLQAIRDMIREI